MRAHQRDLDYSYPDPRTPALTVNQKNVQYCFDNNNGQIEMRAFFLQFKKINHNKKMAFKLHGRMIIYYLTV